MKRVLGIGLVLLGTASVNAWADERLLQAVRNDAHGAIKSLLADHADPNALLPDKSTVLAWAVDRQDPQSVRLLLAAGAKPGIADFSGATPLTVACELDNATIVRALLDAGADTTVKRPDGISAFALCAGTSTPAALGKMIAGGAKVNGADPGGQTALMWAAAKGKSDNIAFLIKHGANVNAVTKKGFTPLFFALRSKVPQAASLLLDAGADAKAVLPDGTSVVGAAVLENNVPFAMAVVSKGAADLSQRDMEGKQLIHVAAASGNVELVKLVLSKGGDANAMTEVPPPAPAPAASNGPPVKGGIAVADGSAGPPKPPIVAMPPLLFAARAGSLGAMKALVQAGAKPDLKADDGTTLALAAAYGGNLAAMKYALELDSDLNALTRSGRSIMHMAVMNPHAPEQEAVIQLLADKGAKLDVKDEHGVTPGDFLNRGQSPETLRVFYIDLLKQHGIVGTAH